jgi:hypothetical protein
MEKITKKVFFIPSFVKKNIIFFFAFFTFHRRIVLFIQLIIKCLSFVSTFFFIKYKIYFKINFILMFVLSINFYNPFINLIKIMLLFLFLPWEIVLVI